MPEFENMTGLVHNPSMKKQEDLIARKEIFRLWYEFYVLALKSTDKDIQIALKKSTKFYADCNVNKDEHFDDWWFTHKTLFIDERSKVRVIDNSQDRHAECLYVEIPKSKSQTEILHEFKEVLAEHLSKSLSVMNRRKTPPPHKYAPTDVQGIKPESMRVLLDLQKHVFTVQDENGQFLKGKKLRESVVNFLTKERYKKKKVDLLPHGLTFSNGNEEEVQRNILRYKKKARQLVFNVASGIFPGKY